MSVTVHSLSARVRRAGNYLHFLRVSKLLELIDLISVPGRGMPTRGALADCDSKFHPADRCGGTCLEQKINVVLQDLMQQIHPEL